MDIRIVEEKTGLTRASIRFYEKEGLVSPRRRENGYRDYSDDDVCTLHKIRLLRELGIPLDQLRQLQTGEQPLEAVLREQETLLQEEQQAWEGRRHRLVEALRLRLTWESLSPDVLDTPPDIPAVEDREEAAGSCRLFLRLTARVIDLTVCILLLMVLLYGVAGHRFPRDTVTSVLELLALRYAGLLALLFLEPACLARFGTTPGKALCGIRVEKDSGTTLSYREAFKRTFLVIRYGLAYLMPVWDIVFLWTSYREVLSGKTTAWEGTSEENTVPVRHPYGKAAAVLLLAVLAALFLVRASLLARHQGALTIAELADNANDYARWLSPDPSDPDTWLRLDETGRYEKTRVKGSPFPAPAVTFLTSGSRVTGVILTWENIPDGQIPPEGQAFVCALAGASPRALLNGGLRSLAVRLSAHLRVGGHTFSGQFARVSWEGVWEPTDTLGMVNASLTAVLP